MIRTTAFVHLRPDVAGATVDRLVDAVRRVDAELDALAVDAARVTPNSVNAGDVMLLGAFADADALERARRHPQVADAVRPLLDECARHVEVVRYEQAPVVLREPAIRDCVHRTLLLAVDPETDPALVARFEHDLADMPRYIEAIRNSSLSRVGTVDGSRGPAYTHVWEQEFASLEGLTGPYMRHAYHWSLVDPWFDAQSPTRIVDDVLVHAACPLRRSFLALGPVG
ncbi:MAG TPA: Dabb family protein [Acidimicrobiia bacterium]|nr:Dabb family protein [Acidimicrobiia bacterium]